MPQYANYQGFITLVDQRGHEATRRFNLDKAVDNSGASGQGDEFVAAADALKDIRDSLSAVSDAVIKRAGVIVTTSESSAVGGPGTDVTDEALLSLFINEAGQREKLWNFSIPSPVPGLFQTDLISVNPNNVPLQAFVGNIADHCFVSDGETVNDLLGTGGLKGGIWRSRQKRGG